MTNKGNPRPIPSRPIRTPISPFERYAGVGTLGSRVVTDHGSGGGLDNWGAGFGPPQAAAKQIKSRGSRLISIWSVFHLTAGRTKEVREELRKRFPTL